MSQETKKEFEKEFDARFLERALYSLEDIETAFNRVWIEIDKKNYRNTFEDQSEIFLAIKCELLKKRKNDLENYLRQNKIPTL